MFSLEFAGLVSMRECLMGLDWVIHSALGQRRQNILTDSMTGTVAGVRRAAHYKPRLWIASMAGKGRTANDNQHLSLDCPRSQP